MRRALLCTLVDSTLRGVFLSGGIGSGKSTLLRSFGAFVRAHVDPDAPFIHIPLGVDANRLIGGIDLDRAMTAGERVIHQGLIADANGGFLFVDDLPLLDESSSAVIVEALEREQALCEREGISACHPSRFVLLATLVPSERSLPLWLADKVGFLIGQEEQLDQQGVGELIRRLEEYSYLPAEFYNRYRAEEEALAERIITARLLHPLIVTGELAITELAEAALKLNVPGNRADIFAVKAARAHAAIRGSRTIEDLDLKFAIATVLAPRAENVPDSSAQSQSEDSPPLPPDAGSGDEIRSDGGVEGDKEEEGSGEEEQAGAGNGSGDDGESREDERHYDAIDFNNELPELAEFFGPARRNRGSGSGGASEQWSRGRHTRSIAFDHRGKRISVGATLRAAAPQQKARGRDETNRRVRIRKEDIRIKRFSERAGTLFIFCVDASGSMALNRMREAKGAVTQLLQEAYINRDTVALIAFRGAEAEVLLPPTSSVERAKRSLDILPTGGGTPLASALLKAYALVGAARRKGVEQTLVVLLTDGRANVPMAESAAGMIMEIRRRHVHQELQRVALPYRREAIRTLVIDTKKTYGAQSEAVRLAELLDARYFYLPQIDAHGLAAVVRESNRG